jgi:hypothetical protein
MDRDKRLLWMELLIGPRLFWTRMSTMPGSNVLADDPRDVTGDTTGAIGELADDFLAGETWFQNLQFVTRRRIAWASNTPW